MKRRDLIKNLTLLPAAGRVLSMHSPQAGAAVGPSTPPQNSAMPDLHRRAFVMDGHTHVMTRELLMNTDIGQRYPDGNVDLPRAKEGGVDAMFFSVYTPENYYPGRFEIKNTFRVVGLALDQIKKNSRAIELARNASDIETRRTGSGSGRILPSRSSPFPQPGRRGSSVHRSRRRRSRTSTRSWRKPFP